MKNKNRFITGYSGLRSLAVIGVILYHLNPNVFIGGYLGVLIFFVLSGYLVTDHMLFSYQTYGKYSNRLFYLKRIKIISAINLSFVDIWCLYFNFSA